MSASGRPVRLAIVDDYDVVVAGVARLLEPFRDRIEVVELVTDPPPTEPIDVALYDAFAHGQADSDDLQSLIDAESARHVAVYTWDFSPTLVETAGRRRLGGYLSKALSGAELAESIERIAGGEFVVSEPPSEHGRPEARGDWPGRSYGLTERESEVLALLTQGNNTNQIADTMHLSPNTIKTHSNSLYRKLGVHSRAEAILWGVDHGFRPDR